MPDVLLWERGAAQNFYFEASRLQETATARRENRGRLGKIREVLERTYLAVETRLPLAERLCSHLRFHDQVTLHVPAGIEAETAAKLFLDFLEKCVNNHRRWLVIDGALAVIGAFLFWAPGPNIFFFYPALRALAHYHALAGGRKHQKLARLTVLHCALLDNFDHLPASEMLRRAGQIENRLGFEHFGAFLEKKYGNQH